MRILFVYGNMHSWGGIQTWLVRVARQLRADGHEVALLSRPGGEPYDNTSVLIEQISHDATIHLADGDWLNAPRSLRELSLPAADVIVPCSLSALLLTSTLHQHLVPTAKVVAGVFNSGEYCWKSSRLKRRWIQHLGARLFRRLPVENLMFATDGMARVTGDCIGRDLSSAPVLPLAIDTDRFRPSPNRRVDRRKIVAVARLAPLYTHHEQMIEVIRELRDRGHDFTYHAYGEGELGAELRAKSQRLGVDDAVFFHGAVPYDQFIEVISDAFVFIGHGTSLLEAAACGLPALVGIDSHPGPATYGFIHDTVGNEHGGYVPGQAEYPIAERVLWLAQRTDEEYQRIQEASRTRAEEFSLTRLLPRFLEILHGAVPFSFDVSRTDRLLARLDRVLARVLWKLGVNTATGHRHLRTNA